MAQINLTLSQDEIQALLLEDPGNAFRKLLESALNSVLKAESAQQLNAAPYERSEERTDSRNGSRDRELLTRLGRITLSVPRHRNVPFKTLLFTNYARSEAALVNCMAEMVVSGVSTRKVSNVIEKLCGEKISKSAVSEACKDLDAAVKAFRERPLLDSYPFLTLDATYFKVRENNRIVSKALMIAHATNANGKREIVGLNAYSVENKENWRHFVQSLKKRGLKGTIMFTSDAHEGIRSAMAIEFPNVPWQRCQFHFAKNIADKAPKRYQPAIRAALQEMFQSKTLTEARKKRDDIMAEYGDIAERAMACLDEGFDSSMTVMVLPVGMRKYYRTSNHLERINRELKRRSDVIGIFPNQESLIRLIGSVLQEIHEHIQLMKCTFSPASLASLMQSQTPQELLVIATEQRMLLAA